MPSPSERDPLLSRDDTDDLEPACDVIQKSPLPWKQLSLVFAIQFTEPVAATVIYPFITQLVRETGITGGDERKNGYYAGLIESMFFLTEALTVYQWGRASDSPRIGRRRVLLLGMLMSTFAVLAFGLSKNFWMLMLTRGILGTCNGNIGVSKAVTAEITDSTNMGDAIAFIPITWALGLTIGPVIGGLLSRPADRWSFFAKIPLFVQFPYFLPCLVASAIPLFTFIFCYLYLEETLPAIIEKKSPGTASSGGDANSEISDSSSQTVKSGSSGNEFSFWSLLTMKQVFVPIMNHSFLALMEQSFNVLIPLVYSTSIPNGGLGLVPFVIGLIMGVVGFVNGMFQLALLSKSIARFGARGLYIVCYATVLFAILAYPIGNAMARVTGSMNPSAWAVLVAQQFCNIPIYAAYGCSFMFIVNGAPTKGSLGATNGLAQMMSTIMRTIAPFFASSLFSVSIEKNIMGGTMVYWVLCALGTIGLYLSLFLPRKLHA
ncbi:major facilitator superfamily domain-containing protein [Pterulicium gracile]|uniref:Major facilitator superfamily domain-containing protein n=1 Tax=Pterulicium gracile TaxID=1884261 RepID=A0A5C3QTV4_9AGAR|nr:major facilitator superfamily domain-containing protein [Pterula gracilis]